MLNHHSTNIFFHSIYVLNKINEKYSNPPVYYIYFQAERKINRDIEFSENHCVFIF